MQTSSEKINVLLLVPTFDSGGTGNAVLTLASSLDRKKFNPIICSMRNADNGAEERARMQKIKVINLDMRSFFNVSVIFKLRKILIEEKIDILHNHGFRPETYGSIAGHLAGCKRTLATILHNPAEDIVLDYGFIVGRIMNFIRLIFASLYEDCLIAISNDAKKGLIKLHFPTKKIRVIYSGINPDLLKQKGISMGLQKFLDNLGFNNNFIVGTVVKLNKRKGVSTLIDGAKRIIKDCPDIRFVIVGSGPEKEKLQNMVKSLGLDKHIAFLGYQKDLVSTLQSFDLMVLPSLTEGLPAILLEAMALKVPIIATSVGGTPEIIENGVNGFLVPPKNSQKLSEKIIEVYKNPDLTSKFVKESLVRFEKFFTAKKTASEYEKVYMQILKK